MRPVELLVLYLVAGIGCAIAAARRGRRAPIDIALTALLWPVYAPLALVDDRREVDAGPAEAELTRLDEAIAGIDDPDLASLLPRRERLAPLAEHLHRLERKQRELSELISREERELRSVDGDDEASKAHASQLRESLEQLRLLERRVARERADVVALCRKLRLALTVIRYKGSSRDGVEPLVHEILGRIEGLGAVFEGELASPRRSP